MRSALSWMVPAGLLLASFGSSPAHAQTCSPGFPAGTAPEVPPGSPPSQNPAAKTWYRVSNYQDRAPLGLIDKNDSFLFSYQGERMLLADPSILRIGDWYYFTGTTDTASRYTINFEIYRTRDFVSFELHMTAFAERRIGAGSWLEGGTLRFSNGEAYNQLWAPQLYRDPTRPGRIFLVFAAVRFLNGEAPEGHHSVFRASIWKDDFLGWQVQGARRRYFGDVRNAGLPARLEGYFYLDSNGTQRYDGGLAIGKQIPAGGALQADADPHLGTACGDLLENENRRLSHVCGHPSTWMSIDPYVFFDPRPGVNAHWKRVMLYNWTEARSGTGNSKGNHIAAAPLEDNRRFFTGASGGLVPLAANRNVSNKIQNIENGGVDGPLDQLRDTGAGIAEGAVAFYHPGQRRYYLVYSRNNVSSPAYQIVYRMSDPGQAFRSLKLASFEDRAATERLLLRSNLNPSTHPGRNVNFGHPEVFSVYDENGQEHFYLIFHARLNGSGLKRTPFVKELTFEADGRIKQLFESHADLDRDIRFFRMPPCRRPPAE